MSTKAQRRRAALLYTAADMHNDDGDFAVFIGDELRELADSLLRRAKWHSLTAKWPTRDEILALIGITLEDLEGRRKSKRQPEGGG
jgi:hypothetical protein